MEKTLTGSQILSKSNYPSREVLAILKSLFNTPRLSDVLMCQESNFREELLVWIVKIQITKTLRG